jgi:hypothetical protein
VADNAAGKAGGGSKSPVDDAPADPPRDSPPQEPPPTVLSAGAVPLPPAGSGGDDDLPAFAFAPPAAAGPTDYPSSRRAAPRTRSTRRERQRQLGRHRLIVLGVFLVVLIVLIVILAKACGGGGAVQPKPHKTKVHKTAAVSASPSASRFHVAVSAAQVAQGGTAQVDYRIGGPAGAKGNVKIVVKNMAGKGVAFFTVAGRQPTGQALVYRFLAVRTPARTRVRCK